MNQKQQRQLIGNMDLAQKTRVYWAVSLAVTQGEGMYKNMSCEKALNILNDITETVGPNKRLIGMTHCLISNIVTPASKKATK